MDDPFFVVVVFMVCSFIVGYVFVGLNARANILEYKQDAITRGYALYCPYSGDWAWKGECKDVNDH